MGHKYGGLDMLFFALGYIWFFMFGLAGDGVFILALGFFAIGFVIMALNVEQEIVYIAEPAGKGMVKIRKVRREIEDYKITKEEELGEMPPRKVKRTEFYGTVNDFKMELWKAPYENQPINSTCPACHEFATMKYPPASWCISCGNYIGGYVEYGGRKMMLKDAIRVSLNE